MRRWYKRWWKCSYPRCPRRAGKQVWWAPPSRSPRVLHYKTSCSASWDETLSAEPGIDEAVRAIGHPGRRAMLRVAHQERSASELAAAAGLSASAASPHLKLLREVGLLQMRWTPNDACTGWTSPAWPRCGPRWMSFGTTALKRSRAGPRSPANGGRP